MSKAQKATLIVATVLLIGGLGLAFSMLVLADFNLGNLSTTRNWTSTAHAFTSESESPHTEIVVRDSSESVRIEPSSSDSIEVECWESENKRFEITDEGGVLSVVGIDRPAPHLFVMDFQNRTTVVRVPASYSGSISIETASGNIEVADLRTVKTVSATTASGNITISALPAAETVFASSTSGSAWLDNVDAASIDARTVSGRINTESCSGERISLESTSGSIFAQIFGTEGDYAIEAASTSGSVSTPVSAPDASKRITMKTVSGSIELSLSGNTEASRTQSDRGQGGTSNPTAPEAPSAPGAPKAPEAPAAPAPPSGS